jgi:hypothetical protein
MFEFELIENFQLEARDDYLQKLDLLEYETLKLQIPKSMSSEYYALRASIDYVRNCLKRGVLPYQLMAQPVDENTTP